jgi:lipopolysaccharide transport system permease protein
MTAHIELEPKPAIERALEETQETPYEYRPLRPGMLGLWSMRHLIAVMVKRDMLGRYKGSVIGFFWTIINPIGHLLLYTFVFSIILKVSFNGNSSTANFAAYLMTGILPWTFLSDSITRAVTCITEQPNLVKRVVFPLEVLPLAVSISSVVSLLLGLSILIAIIGCSTGTFHWTLCFLPILIGSQFLFISGVSWLLASFGVYIQDLRHMLTLGLSIWMYLTPIVYPSSAFPPELQWLPWVNPAAGVIEDYRRVILQGMQPDWPMFAVYTAVGAITWCVGYYFFNKMKRSFADVV